MSTEPKDQIEDIVVSEEKDGSVVVDLPESIQSPDEQEEVHAAEGGSTDDGDADHPDDTDAIRAARRNRRKAKREYMKQTSIEKDARLQNLQRQNQELLERLSAVERRQSGADLARLDKAIEDKELRLQYAKMKLSEATTAGDGEAMAKAQEMWYETRREIEAMRSVKERAAQNVQAQPTDNGEVQRHASRWMDKNDWYDPNGDDEDSQIAKVIDQRMVKEGWNPNSKDYWEELDRRVARKLPHRYTDDTDDQPTRSRPRSVVTSSGRENINSSGSRNTFTLSPEQVRAMKDAGMWDDQAKRSKMIKRYAMEARQNNGYRS
jgi:hypothetical protein